MAEVGETEENTWKVKVIFPTKGSNQGPLHCRRILYQLNHQGSLKIPGDNLKQTRIRIQWNWLILGVSSGNAQVGRERVRQRRDKVNRRCRGGVGYPFGQLGLDSAGEH